MSRPEYLQIRTEQIRPALDVICNRMGLDPDARGSYAEAVQFAVTAIAYDLNIEAQHDAACDAGLVPGRC